MSSVASVAGPDLPVRFSAWSIASNRDSKDPFSHGGRPGGTSGEHGGEALSDAQCTLTSASFRQRMDSARSFTASAPPGARPPSGCRGQAHGSGMHAGDGGADGGGGGGGGSDDDDEDDDDSYDGCVDHGGSRRDSL